MIYTAIGEQVGLAQRMESVAPPGGVMLSDSTVRLVRDAVVLSEPESIHIKGSPSLVTARRLLAVARTGDSVARNVSILVGRDWEVSTFEAMLNQSINGKGRIVGLVGPPGIGKSRLAGEITSLAANRSFQVFSTQCESHTSAWTARCFGIDGIGSRALGPDDSVAGLVAQVAERPQATRSSRKNSSGISPKEAY
jgi:adenylate cyclase